MASEKQNLTAQAADRIFHMITAQPGYGPGDQLPTENELCGLLQVSRTTVRAAIALLANQGYVEVRRGLGTFVAPGAALRQDIGFSALNAVRVRLKDLMEMRMMFEPHTAALACNRGTEPEIQRIADCARRVEELIHQGADWAAADIDYHQSIVSASHNQFMEQLMPIINKACTETWAMRHTDQELPGTVLEDNRMMIGFLRQRDVQGCKYAMAAHLRHMAGMFGFDSEDIVGL